MTNNELLDLARLLVKYHNHINSTKRYSLYGEKMDKALCCDTFFTLFAHTNYDDLINIKKTFDNH